MTKVRYRFQPKRAAAHQRAVVPAPERVPRVARLLALAHKFQGMLDRGEVASMADMARLGGVSRARITQIMDLLLLAPEIQEELLFAAAGSLREPTRVAREVQWGEQRLLWRELGVRAERADDREDGGFGDGRVARGTCRREPVRRRADRAQAVGHLGRG